MEHFCMKEVVKEAVAIASAQAGVRMMDDAEISAMIASLASTIHDLARANTHKDGVKTPVSPQAKKVVCLECGKTLKSLSGKHLGTHGITVEEYRKKHSLGKN